MPIFKVLSHISVIMKCVCICGCTCVCIQQSIHAAHTHTFTHRTACEGVHLNSTGSSSIHPLPPVCPCAVLAVGEYGSVCVCVCVCVSVELPGDVETAQ